jgi:cobalt-zinc-cadmium efflux system outer membrane protein
MRQIIFLFLSLFSLNCFSQKQLTIKEAEEQLQKNNLLLLAEQYNITASQAAVIQAKIWEQPYLTAEINTINPEYNKVFDVGGQGQKVLAIQQLIYLGGKKKNEINFAKSNVALAELEFEQLMRNLKFQLNQTFYSVYFDKQKVNFLDVGISVLDTLVKNYSTQANKGNIPLREVVRLQSLVLNLKNEKNNIVKNIIEEQQNLSLLTGIAETIEPLVNEPELIENFQSKLISKDNILSAALENNVEYLIAIKLSESQEAYLKWQKSLAVPDIITGLAYDQRGGAFQNQVNITLGIPLPLWNKNKGNIKMAEAQLQQTNFNKDFKKLELQTKVETYWQLWQQQVKQYQNIDKSTISNLEEVYNGTLSNFQKRNITMLEFTDFMESYTQSSIQINEIKKSLILSGLNLNFITNKEIF